MEEKKEEKETPELENAMKKYSRGAEANLDGVRNINLRKKLIRREKKIKYAEKQAARTELLLTGEEGHLVAEEGEVQKRFTQSQLCKNVDLISAAKCFNLDLAFGPYRLDYTRNGRHLLLGGKKGHIAAMDWITKRLMCEINVMEEVFDVQWLHIETMYAVAQKNWVYMYDNQGVEIHCIKALNRILQMQFLPYHFLLATASVEGWLSWLDISIGEMVVQFETHKGRLNALRQNPYNATLCCAHPKGVVSMWTPNAKKPVAQIQCHKTGVQAIAIDHTGKYLATSAVDNSMKIWDIRAMVGPIETYLLRGAPQDLSFSQRGFLAVAINNNIEVYKNCHIESVKDSYLCHKTLRNVYNLEFCPYEDVLGLGTGDGFASILVPGAGEANFDGLEVNPFASKSQRREAEVKSLLEKIPSHLITLDPNMIAQIDVPTLKEKIEAKRELAYLKVPKIDFEPRRRKHGSSVRAARAKKIVKEAHKKNFRKEMKMLNRNKEAAKKKKRKKENKMNCAHVLNRFRSKKKK